MWPTRTEVCSVSKVFSFIQQIKLRRSKFDNQRPLNPGDLLASIMASLSFLLRCISNVFGIPHISSVPSVCCKICLLEIESLHITVFGGVVGKVPEIPNPIPKPKAFIAVWNFKVLSTLAVLQQNIFDQFAVISNLSPCPFFSNISQVHVPVG